MTSDGGRWKTMVASFGRQWQTGQVAIANGDKHWWTIWPLTTGGGRWRQQTLADMVGSGKWWWLATTEGGRQWWTMWPSMAGGGGQ